MRETIETIKWFSNEYRVTHHTDSGTSRIEQLVKRKKGKETWMTLFFGHTELLELFTPNNNIKKGKV